MPVADRLKQPLDRLCREFDWTQRVGQDAIQFPLRYTDPADIELAGPVQRLRSNFINGIKHMPVTVQAA